MTCDTEINFDNPTACPKGTMNITAKETCCGNMNKIRLPFADCCYYPILVIPYWEQFLCGWGCSLEVLAGETTNERCCNLQCSFLSIGVIGLNSVKDGINIAGLINSFMWSVGEDPR